MGVCVWGGGGHDRKRLPSFYFASGHVTGFPWRRTEFYWVFQRVSSPLYLVLLGFSVDFEGFT